MSFNFMAVITIYSPQGRKELDTTEQLHSLTHSITICSDFGNQKIKPSTVSTVSPSICHEVEDLEELSHVEDQEGWR